TLCPQHLAGFSPLWLFAGLPPCVGEPRFPVAPHTVSIAVLDLPDKQRLLALDSHLAWIAGEDSRHDDSLESPSLCPARLEAASARSEASPPRHFRPL